MFRKVLVEKESSLSIGGASIFTTILQWEQNNIKNRKMTNGDYFRFPLYLLIASSDRLEHTPVQVLNKVVQLGYI